MANGENLQSQDQNLNNETSQEEVNTNENIQADAVAQTPEETTSESASETKEEQLSSEVSEEVNSAAPPEESNEPAEAAEEKPAEAAEEKPAETAEEKPVEAVEEKPVEAVEEKPAEVAEEKPAEEKKDENSEKFEEIFNSLKQKKENNETIKVNVLKKIRGGLRVVYDDMPLFLPASHFSIKKSTADDELSQAVGQEIEVHIHELSQEEETNRKTVIVSRKKLLNEAFWNNINIGDQVKGTVSSIASFGVFLDLGGYEGLIHISRLSQSHVDHPKNVCKKGDKLTAVVVDINREKERIALSRKELEDSPWENIEEEFPKGTVIKGKVKRLTDFGAYVELKEGVDGLLRTNEISWTERIRKPSDVLKVGEDIEVEVLSSNASKRTASLSYKNTQPNPWNELQEKYPVGTEIKGIVKQIVAQGAVFTIEGNIDGFMPKSKMRNLTQGKKIPYNIGEEVELKIADLVPEKESLIFAPVVDENAMEEARKHEPRPRRGGGGNQGRSKASSTQNDEGAFTFMDLLSDKEKSDLSNVNR